MRRRDHPQEAPDPGLYTSLMVYELCVSPLSAGEREAYYQEVLRVVRYLGLTQDAAPATLVEMRSYMDHQVETGVVSRRQRLWRAEVALLRAAVRLAPDRVRTVPSARRARRRAARWSAA